MRAGKRVREALRETGEDLLGLCELIGYLVLISAMSHFVQTTPWHDGLIGLAFVVVMVVRRFRRWIGKPPEDGPR